MDCACPPPRALVRTRRTVDDELQGEAHRTVSNSHPETRQRFDLRRNLIVLFSFLLQDSPSLPISNEPLVRTITWDSSSPRRRLGSSQNSPNTSRISDPPHNNDVFSQVNEENARGNEEEDRTSSFILTLPIPDTRGKRQMDRKMRHKTRIEALKKELEPLCTDNGSAIVLLCWGESSCCSILPVPVQYPEDEVATWTEINKAWYTRRGTWGKGIVITEGWTLDMRHVILPLMSTIFLVVVVVAKFIFGWSTAWTVGAFFVALTTSENLISSSPVTSGPRVTTRAAASCAPPFDPYHQESSSDSETEPAASARRKRGFSQVTSSPPTQTQRSAPRADRQGNQSGQTRSHDAPFCTQRCLLGLQQGSALDPACPNTDLHILGRREDHHLISAADLVKKLKVQLDQDLDYNCTPMGPCGSCGSSGAPFKITCSTFGYTVVGKGTT
ncbi:unnamed protein product [Aspergillus oryzae]|nr:unnamed protein product [Aspergillus oryzae]